MTYKGYADKEKRKEYLKLYMRDRREAKRKTQEREEQQKKLAILDIQTCIDTIRKLCFNIEVQLQAMKENSGGR